MFLFATSGAIPALIVVLGLAVTAMVLAALFKLTRMAQEDVAEDDVDRND